MFFGQLEREILCEEIYTTCQYTKIPEDLEIISDKTPEKYDIWAYYTENQLKSLDNSQTLMKEAQGNKI
ncbi:MULTISPECIES: hypothetical protein [unclassified Anabaena]|uniref:hypothetical protein n=1 Tax=unclassified Anabaena TaxID=2619674 RepID=UPI000831E8CB|nr:MULTISPECIES: hypothetical protein [unclassified Anabaena]